MRRQTPRASRRRHGALYNEGISFPARSPRALVCLLLCGAAACRAGDEGLSDDWIRHPRPRLDAAPSRDATDGPASTDATDAGSDLRRDAAALTTLPPPGIVGPPAVVGCSDGSREGFLDVTAWQRIAGCSGGWEVAGLVGPATREPQCQRQAGNDIASPDLAQVRCSVADLCAAGWHVCESAEEIRRSSPTECESAVPFGHVAFFVTRTRSTPFGLCLPDPTLANDLHGCGNFGAPESGGCQPLDRRLSFVECGRSAAWKCGDEQNHLDEANLVTKIGASEGGVLCCRD